MVIDAPVIFNRNLCKGQLAECERPGTAEGDAEVTQRETELLPMRQSEGERRAGCWNLGAGGPAMLRDGVPADWCPKSYRRLILGISMLDESSVSHVRLRLPV